MTQADRYRRLGWRHPTPVGRWLFQRDAHSGGSRHDHRPHDHPVPLTAKPLGTLTSQLQASLYLLGDRMSAADILWGIALYWGVMFKLVPETPVVLEYAQRICSRPSFLQVSERDVALAAEHEAAVKAAG
ncbi:glutathione binding-like protein [Paraburkholderia sp. GAS348]|uniref:glutathione binding-like protein n=1 Tax=Paraburkholderia sp. GAS348 TaxID=3035132 RepID=UPI003D1C7B32